MKQGLMLLISLALLCASCTTQKAVVKHKRDIHSGAMQVTPQWKTQETGLSKSMPYLLGAAGAGLGYGMSFDYDGKTYEKGSSAALLGIGSWIASLYLKKLLMPEQEQKPYNGDYSAWLRNYNDKHRTNYVTEQVNPNGSLVIVPKHKIGHYRSTEQEIALIAQRKKIEREQRLEELRRNPLRHSDWEPVALFKKQVFPSFIIGMSYFSGKVDIAGEGDVSSSLGVAITPTVDDMVVSVEVETVDNQFFEKSTQDFRLGKKGETKVLFPNVRWRMETLRKHKQSTPIKVTYRIKTETEQYEKTETLYLKSINDCILFHEDNDFRWLFTAYVNEEHDEIDLLLREALDTKFVDSFIGYQGTGADVMMQVAAIWRVLQERGFKYTSITGSGESDNGIFSQPVRLFSEAIQTSQANCIDGTIVFASILKKIGIDPIIYIVPGHAFLGYYLNKEKTKVAYLETTLLGEDEFLKNINQSDNKSLNKAYFSAFMYATEKGKDKYGEYESRQISKIDVSAYRKLVKPIGD